MDRQPPSRRSIDSLRKEAKRWLAALRSSDADAHARLARALNRVPPAPTLRDVQHALAREHGFEGWLALKAAIEQAASRRREAGPDALARYRAMADALLEAYRTGTPEAMERLHSYTWHRRAWRAMRTYVQLDLGKRPAGPDDEVEISLEEACDLVAREHGFGDWAQLSAFAMSPGRPARSAAKPVRVVVREGPGQWHTVARTRDWDEVIGFLGQHPGAGLSAEGQVTDALLAELSLRLDTISALDLSGSKALTDQGVHHLGRLPSLEHLDLSGTGITDAGLGVLAQLTRLRTISLAWTRVTDAGVRSLASCHGLEDVNLAETGAGDASLRTLAGKAKLSRLAITLSDAGLPLLRELPVFKAWQGGEADLRLLDPRSLPNQLTLRGSFTDRGLQHLRDLEGLFALDIDDRRLDITAAGLPPLVDLPHLGALSLDAKDDWMPWLAEMPHLRFLGVQDTTAGDEGFVALSRSRSVEHIWGRRCHNLRRRGFLALAAMPALTGLSVSCLNVDEAGISALPAFPALRELMPMDIPDAGYRHVGRCEALESLVLMYCRDATDVATSHITGLKRLSYYFNSYTTITDRTPELLSAMESLERVTFDACHGLTDAGVARLARLPRLRELRLSGRGLTTEVVKAFPAAVRVSYEL